MKIYFTITGTQFRRICRSVWRKNLIMSTIRKPSKS